MDKNQKSPLQCVSEAEQVLNSELKHWNTSYGFEDKFKVLQIISSLIGVFPLEYIVPKENISSFDSVRPIANKVYKILKDSNFNTSLLLASLSELEVNTFQKRSNGIYFSDYRLASFLSSKLKYEESFTLLDPACGSGILLISAVIDLNRNYDISINDLLRNSIFGADISNMAINAAFICLSSLTNDKLTISSIRKNLKVADSLIEGDQLWKRKGIKHFNAIIANPPWEKLTIRNYEIGKSLGFSKNYGEEYIQDQLNDINSIKINSTLDYKKKLKSLFKHQGAGEIDLYKLFLELAFNLVKTEGIISILIPTGLIRSKSTFELREKLFEDFSNIKISLFDNKPGFFKIDSRFKFLHLFANKKQDANLELSLDYPQVSQKLITENEIPVRLSVNFIKKTFTTLIIPEIKSEAYSVFLKFVNNSIRLGEENNSWDTTYHREIDMTLNKNNFCKAPVVKDFGMYYPLIEGRMVNQYTSTAKKYVSGQGRSAVWSSNNGNNQFKPQYYYPKELLPDKIKEKISKSRIGFCDISGQTNERTMLAAYIPPGVVCGNKVPTLTFSTLDEQSSYCWIAIANSFAYDWFLRRIVTTTINHFLLLETRFPKILPSSKNGELLATASKILSLESDLMPIEKAALRLKMDLIIFKSFKFNFSDLKIIFEDFSSIDRSQPALPDEKKSTITKDYILYNFLISTNDSSSKDFLIIKHRVEKAFSLGAIPYISSTL